MYRLRMPTMNTAATVTTSHSGCVGSHMMTKKLQADTPMSTQHAILNHVRHRLGAER